MFLFLYPIDVIHCIAINLYLILGKRMIQCLTLSKNWPGNVICLQRKSRLLGHSQGRAPNQPLDLLKGQGHQGISLIIVQYFELNSRDLLIVE